MTGSSAGPGPVVPGKSILVVDDEPAVLAVASRILRRHGYDTAEARSCAEALALLAGREFDLLLTDSVMPEMSGLALAERVAELRPGQRVLHMSGYSAEALDRLRLSQERNPPFLPKPFTAGTLVDKVEQVLNAPPPSAPPRRAEGMELEQLPRSAAGLARRGTGPGPGPQPGTRGGPRRWPSRPRSRSAWSRSGPRGQRRAAR